MPPTRRGVAKEAALTSGEEDWLGLPAGEFLRRWYLDEYCQKTYSGAAGRIQQWMHRSIERGYSQETRFGDVLEVGAIAASTFLLCAIILGPTSFLTSILRKENSQILFPEG